MDTDRNSKKMQHSTGMEEKTEKVGTFIIKSYFGQIDKLRRFMLIIFDFL